MAGSRNSSRRATNLTLDADLLAEARALKVNLSRAAEAGIGHAVAEIRAGRWRSENREALESSNRYVERNGLPLSGLRPF